MHLRSALASILVLCATLSLARPSAKNTKRGVSFSLKTTRAPGESRRPLRRDSGSVAASPVATNNDWTIPVAIGGQTFALTVDTGSTDLWVKSTLMPPDQQQSAGVAIYDPSQSSSYQPLPSTSAIETLNTKYVAGLQIYGVVATETVQIGPLIANNLPFTPISNINSQWGTSGVIGLGLLADSRVKPDVQLNFWQAVQATLDQPVFAVKFHTDSSGSLDFGTIDPNQSQNLISAPIDTSLQGPFPNSWAVAGVTITAGNAPASDPVTFQYDTGCSQTFVPPAVAAAYWAQVPNVTPPTASQARYAFSCDTTLPDLVLTFTTATGGATPVTISGSSINAGVVDSANNICVGRLLPTIKPGLYCVGTAWFLSYYTVFNWGTAQISFAPQS